MRTRNAVIKNDVRTFETYFHELPENELLLLIARHGRLRMLSIAAQRQTDLTDRHLNLPAQALQHGQIIFTRFFFCLNKTKENLPHKPMQVDLEIALIVAVLTQEQHVLDLLEPRLKKMKGGNSLLNNLLTLAANYKNETLFQKLIDMGAKVPTDPRQRGPYYWAFKKAQSQIIQKIEKDLEPLVNSYLNTLLFLYQDNDARAENICTKLKDREILIGYALRDEKEITDTLERYRSIKPGKINAKESKGIELVSHRSTNILENNEDNFTENERRFYEAARIDNQYVLEHLFNNSYEPECFYRLICFALNEHNFIALKNILNRAINNQKLLDTVLEKYDNKIFILLMHVNYDLYKFIKAKVNSILKIIQQPGSALNMSKAMHTFDQLFMKEGMFAAVLSDIFSREDYFLFKDLLFVLAFRDAPNIIKGEPVFKLISYIKDDKIRRTVNQQFLLYIQQIFTWINPWDDTCSTFKLSVHIEQSLREKFSNEKIRERAKENFILVANGWGLTDYFIKLPLAANLICAAMKSTGLLLADRDLASLSQVSSKFSMIFGRQSTQRKLESLQKQRIAHLQLISGLITQIDLEMQGMTANKKCILNLCLYSTVIVLGGVAIYYGVRCGQASNAKEKVFSDFPTTIYSNQTRCTEAFPNITEDSIEIDGVSVCNSDGILSAGGMQDRVRHDFENLANSPCFDIASRLCLTKKDFNDFLFFSLIISPPAGLFLCLLLCCIANKYNCFATDCIGAPSKAIDALQRDTQMKLRGLSSSFELPLDHNIGSIKNSLIKHNTNLEQEVNKFLDKPDPKDKLEVKVILNDDDNYEEKLSGPDYKTPLLQPY